MFVDDQGKIVRPYQNYIDEALEMIVTYFRVDPRDALKEIEDT